jgi:UDP:flavonoid glycosyltransferase YjiC (YdhE family)
MGYAGLRRKYPDVAGLKLHWPFDGAASATPLIFAYSPTVVPPPAGWAPHIHVAGYAFLEAPAGYEPPRQLAQFLEAGEPPVCVSFGSMVSRLGAGVSEIALAALQATGQRGIIVRGWGAPAAASGNERVLYVDDVPYDWLFPRCAAAVHHGGAGTTAAALRAGVPSVVVPHAADQPFWGKRVAALGAGPQPVPVRRLTTARLAAALQEARQVGLRSGAQAVARSICEEDGVARAVQIIEASRP